MRSTKTGNSRTAGKNFRILFAVKRLKIPEALDRARNCRFRTETDVVAEAFAVSIQFNQPMLSASLTHGFRSGSGSRLYVHSQTRTLVSSDSLHHGTTTICKTIGCSNGTKPLGSLSTVCTNPKPRANAVVKWVRVKFQDCDAGSSYSAGPTAGTE